MSGCEGGSCSTCGGQEPSEERLPPGMLRRYDLNQSTAEGTLVWVELSDGVPTRCSLEMLSQARRMTDGRVFAVLFGPGGLKSVYVDLFAHGADTVYHVRDACLESYHPEAYCDAIASVCERVNPAVVLVAASPRGREVAPRLASTLRSGLCADCTGLEMDGRNLVATRPAFGGNILARIGYTQYPQIATVREGTFPTEPVAGRTGTAIYWQCPRPETKEILEEKAKDAASADICDARILIAVGNGIRDRSLVELAGRIAERIGGALCCSRPVADKGWLPRSVQVGMSGRNVKPNVYIALGISGSVQHRAGMSGSVKVIAVNPDPEAPIHGESDLSLLCDAGPVLRSMARSLGLDQ
ncbi:MAG: electron transfer flavoprotein subunit alpha/FixB family protein [Candidatus Methanomethylophilaceae archaeon]|nr:electron transfer flavoprotein subunit alpha/FixB family protein [Candidatus Methanomethylophilaceae archaeon]